MRIFPQQLFIMRLNNAIPNGSEFHWIRNKSIQECVEGLKKLSGLDFGTDAKAWQKWWEQEKIKMDIDPDF